MGERNVSDSGPPPSATPVTVAIPLLDDRDGIAACLDAVLRQRSERSTVSEVLVYDGGSTDGSREIVEARSAEDARVQLLENPDRHVPSAMNAAIAAMTTNVLVRIDSHAVVADDYCDRAVDLLDETGADVVGGHMRPHGVGPVGRAIAWALCSRWGIGGSSFHDVAAEGPAQSVYMGVFRRDAFDRFGDFDERFTRNQDDELAYRFTELGGSIWLSGRLRSTYEPRDSFTRLRRQFEGYGRYKPMVLALHPSGARLRHAAPAIAVTSWLALPLAARWRALALPPALHLAAVTIASARGPADTRWVDRARGLLTMHLAYGWGFLRGTPAGLKTASSTRRPGGTEEAGSSRRR